MDIATFAATWQPIVTPILAVVLPLGVAYMAKRDHWTNQQALAVQKEVTAGATATMQALAETHAKTTGDLVAALPGLLQIGVNAALAGPGQSISTSGGLSSASGPMRTPAQIAEELKKGGAL